jgi:hypothetical protein
MSKTAAGIVPLSRLVHHAEAAGFSDEVLRLAPLAAREASASSAHREAAELYALALRHGEDLPPPARADLFAARAHECMLTNLSDQAIEARLAALALRRSGGDTLQEGVNLRWLARLHWLRDADPVAHTYADEAVAVLGNLPPSHELAMAYSTMSQLQMVCDRTGLAMPPSQCPSIASAAWRTRRCCLDLCNGRPECHLRTSRDARSCAGASRSLQLYARYAIACIQVGGKSGVNRRVP